MTQFRNAITFGRFNLLHKGHIDLFQQMKSAADSVLIGVSSAPQNLSYRDRSQVIQKALRGQTCYSIQPSRTPFNLLTGLDSLDSTVVYFGEDQYELAKNIERAFSVKTQLIPRITSSTEIRALLDAQDWSRLLAHCPAEIIQDLFLLRERELCLNSH